MDSVSAVSPALSDVVGLTRTLVDIPSTTGGEAEAGQIAKKLIARVSEPYTIGTRVLAIGASIGIALFPDDADTADQLLVLADSAMYVAKRAGGGRHHRAA